MIHPWRAPSLALCIAGAMAFAPFVAKGGAQLFSVELTSHRDKTRVVFGLPQATAFQAAIDDSPGDGQSGRLTVEFPNVKELPDGGIGRGQGLVRSYRAEAMGGGGVRVILELARPAVIADVRALPAEPGRPPRAEVDLVASGGAAMHAVAGVAFLPEGALPVRPAPPAPQSTVPSSIGALIEGADENVPPVPPANAIAAPAHPRFTLTPPPSPPVVAQPVAVIREAPAPQEPEPPPRAAVLVSPPEPVQPKPARPKPTSIIKAAMAAVSAPRITAAAPSKPVIVIDAGHGGVDPGAESVAGYHEKEITLATARLLRRTLEQSGRYKVVLTRDSDVYLKLHERVRRARAAQGNLFISLHADSVPGGSSTVHGASIYTLSETSTDAESERLAQRENRADAIGGVDLGDQSDDVAGILVDLTVRETVNDGNRLAGMMVDALQHQGISLLSSDPHRSAGFAVLKSPDIPSVLIEMGYLSDIADARGLADPRHESQIAKAIGEGVDRYFTWLQTARS